MQNLQAAMHELHLHDGFSAEELKKQFHRLSVRCHPDKPGGSTARMQRILAAREVCIEFLARPTHPEQFAQNLRKRADPPETHPGNGIPTPPASACPSADDLDAWTSHAVEFLAKLKESGPRHRERQSLRAQIKQVAIHSGWNLLLEFALDCIKQLARSTKQQCASGVKSWEACGFKYLSYQGYDVICDTRAVDYGNYEYLAVLEFWSLREPKIWESLNSMRDAWPTVLDLWHTAKTERHVERLADVVEIVMGALRGGAWFHDCIVRLPEKRLPVLFALHVALCRLVQLLNARLTTGYLKYKREPLTKLDVPCMFSDLWIAAGKRNSGYSSGLLLCGLLRAAAQMA